MKTIAIFILAFCLNTVLLKNINAANYTWTGSTSTARSNSGNWNPSGIPDSTDNVTIVSTTNQPILDQNRKVNNLTMTSGTLDMNGYEMQVNGTGTFTSGTITNGNFKARGILADFKGTMMDCTVDAICGYIKLSGSQFEEDAWFEDTGYATGTGDGGNIFNGNVTIKHTGSGTYFHLATTSGDVFNGNLTLINTSTHEIHVGRNDTTNFNGNIEVNNTGTGGITFGNNGGISYLASGKNITVGSTGFTNDILLLKNFNQSGSTSQTLTLTGSATANLISSTFDGVLTITAPLFLIKDNTFNGTTTLTKNGSSNGHSDGGNTFNGYPNTIANTGTAGRIRLSTTTADTYNENISFESTGQAIQVAYTGESIFRGNITINHSNIVFNAGTGTAKMAGPYSGSTNPSVSNNQELNGSTSYQFKNLTIDKDAGYVTANKPLSIDNILTLTKGHLQTDTTNLLTMKAGSSVSGASNNSFVSGPVKKIGNTAFEFPVGDMEAFLPVSITSPNLSTDAFTAQLIFSRQLLGNDKESPLDYLSEYCFWKLERTSGSSKVKIGLKWDNSFNPVIDTSRLHIAYWDNDEWKNLGHGILSGNYTTGSILSSDSLDSYGNYIHAYLENPDEINNRSIGFIRNDGQLLRNDSVPSSEALFYSSEGSFAQYYKADTIVHVLSVTHNMIDTMPDSLYRVDMILLNADLTVTPIGVEPNESYLNFLLGYLPDPVVEVPNYNKVVYESAFEEVDLVISKQNVIHYELIIHPGGRADSVKFKFDGAISVSEADNQLFIATPIGYLTYDVPRAWYDSAGTRIAVDAGYRIIGNDSVSLEIGAYNPEFTIVLNIGPPVPVPPNNAFGNLYWSSFVETNVNITDAYFKKDDNTIYTIGNTSAQVVIPAPSTIATFPNNNSQDALVVKFNANRGVSWWTYFGGGLAESENRILIDNNGDIIVAGVTNSPDISIESCTPCSSCYCQSFNSIPELYFARIHSSGQPLIYSTFFGGSGTEELHSITGDLNGNIYLGGVNFNSSGFPFHTQTGAYNQTYGGGANDPFVAKFNSSNQLVWSTSFGGDNSLYGGTNEEVTGMCTDNSGNLYLTGTTGSYGSDPFLTCSPCTTNTQLGEFPITILSGGAFVESNQGSTDAYFIKFDTQNRLVWSTMFGGSDMELFQGFVHNNKGIAVNNTGEIFSIGSTKSTDIDDWVPSATTGSYFQDTHMGNFDMYIVKFSPQFELLYATLYGGTGEDVGIGVTTDLYGNIYFTGSTSSSHSSTDPFPLQEPNASSPGGVLEYQDTYGGGASDAFLIKFQSNLKHLLTTYIGGDGDDVGRFVLSNAAGNNVILGGRTNSTNNFNIADPGGLSYFKGTNPGINGGFMSNMVNVCTGCREMIVPIMNPITETNLLLYPNPAVELLFIQPSNMILSGEVSIYDLTGRKISVPIHRNEQYLIADVKQLEKGIYICSYVLSNTRMVGKFIIQH